MRRFAVCRSDGAWKDLLRSTAVHFCGTAAAQSDQVLVRVIPRLNCETVVGEFRDQARCKGGISTYGRFKTFATVK